jgi:hypothetical protein
MGKWRGRERERVCIWMGVLGWVGYDITRLILHITYRLYISCL